MDRIRNTGRVDSAPSSRRLDRQPGCERRWPPRKERNSTLRGALQSLLLRPVRFAALYSTGQDSVSAWIDGTQVLAAKPLPAWHQMPWKKFVRADVTAQLNPGANTLAIESVHYVVNPNGMAAEDPPPMIATLVVNMPMAVGPTSSSSPELEGCHSR